MRYQRDVDVLGIQIPGTYKCFFIVMAFLYCLSSIEAKGQAAHSKPGIRGVYTAQKEFCTSSFLFLPGGLFYYEGGCEDRSYILKGGYKVTKDSVTFFADPVPLRYHIQSDNNIAVGQKKLTLRDNEGKPLPIFNVFTLPAVIYGDTLSYIKQVHTDSNGILLLDPLQTTCISLDRFNANRLNKDHHFKWEQLAVLQGNAITIQFNYPIFCLKYPEIQVAGGFPALKRKTDDDTLIDDQHNIYTKTKN